MSYFRWVMYTREGWMNQISRKCHLSRKWQSGLSNNRWFYLYIFTCVYIYIYIHKFVPYIHIWHFEPDSPHIAFSFTPIMIEISWISTFDNVLWHNLGRWDSTKPLRKEQNHALFHDHEDQTWYLRGFNPSEKYSWNLIISLSRGEQNSLKPHENRSGPIPEILKGGYQPVVMMKLTRSSNHIMPHFAMGCILPSTRFGSGQTNWPAHHQTA